MLPFIRRKATKQELDNLLTSASSTADELTPKSGGDGVGNQDAPSPTARLQVKAYVDQALAPGDAEPAHGSPGAPFQPSAGLSSQGGGGVYTWRGGRWQEQQGCAVW